MAHHQIEVAEEHYVFKPETRKKLIILLIVGIAVFALGLVLAMSGGGHEEAKHEGGHASAVVAKELVASTQHEAAAAESHGAEAGHHAETASWLKRIYTTLWMNNVFFTGLGIIGLFFVAIQYAAQAGWSVGVKRIGMAMATWIPIAGILMLGLYFLTHHDIFHWTHSSLYHEGEGFDPIINKKAPFFFWPLAGGTFPVFFLGRMVLFFAVWYWFFTMIRKNMRAEDLENSTKWWHKNQVLSTVFLIFFGISSSVAA
ncbi:MAG TPA: quinol:cytochrome C oxidoreductase, partial [Chryseolinea sp.]|nr:quinol:cytochrome C oxidoreductase [Chryseolinea sp.]